MTTPADRAAPSEAVEVMARKQSDGSTGDALNDFAVRWKLNGDWIQRRKCERPQQVSWMLHDFRHASWCKATQAEHNPWMTLRSLICAQLSNAKLPGATP